MFHTVRSAHLWYFEKRSLIWTAIKAGFSEAKEAYFHGYDLSNAFCWLKENKPTGLKHMELFDSSINKHWCDYLEKMGWADTLWLIVKKES
jgi:hypothetical protein